MKKSEMVSMIRNNLVLADGVGDLTISDTVLMVCSYCNIPTNSIPKELEPFIRRKVKGILDYEAVNGTGYNPEVASIKEGDGSITWSQTDGNTKASIYGLSDSDKKDLRRYRRLRGYA